MMDGAIDDVLTKVRSAKQDGAESSASLETFIKVMNTLGTQKAQPANQAPVSGSSTKPLGDLSAFRKIADDMLKLVRAGDMSGAKARAGDLETAWDNAQPRLKPMNTEKWTLMDNAIDDVLKKVRAVKPNNADSSASLASFIAVIDTNDNPK